MARGNKARLTLVAGVVGGLLAGAASAQMPTDRPFSMRGVELGITLEEFRAAPIPNDGGRYRDTQTICTNGTNPLKFKIEGSYEDQEIGIVECQWFSNLASVRIDYPTPHWVNIGDGGGFPLFRFVDDNGKLRLFQVKFHANIEYHHAIRDALARGYGEPSETTEPFKTKAGAEFTSLTSRWGNGLSTITLVERCGHLERYCLSYEHTKLTTSYLEIKERRAEAAASRI